MGKPNSGVKSEESIRKIRETGFCDKWDDKCKQFTDKFTPAMLRKISHTKKVEY